MLKVSVLVLLPNLGYLQFCPCSGWRKEQEEEEEDGEALEGRKGGGGEHILGGGEATCPPSK